MLGDVIVIENTASPVLAGHQVTVNLLFRTGAAQGEFNTFGQIRDVELLDDLRVAVLDRVAQNVTIMSATGNPERVIGRPGNGPGELTNGITHVLFWPPDRILVTSLFASSPTVFGLDGTFRKRLVMPNEGTLVRHWRIGPENEILYDVRPSPFSDLQGDTDGVYLRVWKDSVIGEFLLGPKDQVVDRGVARLYLPMTVWTVKPSGEIVAGDGRDYELRVMTSKGRLTRIVRKAHSAQPISRQDQEFLFDEYERWLNSQQPRPPVPGNMRDFFGFASHYPAFTEIQADDAGRVWVQLPATAAYLRSEAEELRPGMVLGSSVWDVFDESGRYLAQVKFPFPFRLTRLRSNVAVGTRVLNGVPVVEAFSVNFPEVKPRDIASQ